MHGIVLNALDEAVHKAIIIEAMPRMTVLNGIDANAQPDDTDKGGDTAGHK